MSARRDAADRRRPFQRVLRRAILDRDDHRCRKCGFNAPRDAGLELHHVIEVADGGTDDEENLVTLCGDCHREWTFCPPVEVSLDVWLRLTPARILVRLLANLLPGGMSAAEWQRAVLDGATIIQATRGPSSGA